MKIQGYQIRIMAEPDVVYDLKSTTFDTDLKKAVADVLEKHLPEYNIETISQVGVSELLVYIEIKKGE